MPGEDGVFFFFAGDQVGELLLAFEGGVLAADFGAQLVNFALQLAYRKAGVGGGLERAGAKAGTGLAERLVKPDGEGSGQLEAIHGLLVPGAKLVGGLVAFDAQDVKHLADGGVEADFAVEPKEQVGLAGFAGEFDAAAGGDVLGQCLAQLAQLDQRGVRIGSKDLLGGNGQLQENGVMLGEEGEIAGAHIPTVDIAFGMSTNITRFQPARLLSSSLSHSTISVSASSEW